MLPFSMLLLVPVGLYNLNWFFPALMVLLGAHYLPFATLYGMRMFLFLAGILIAMGVVIAHYFRERSALAHGSPDWPSSFSLGLGVSSRSAKPPRLPLTSSACAPWDESGTTETEIPNDCLSRHRFLISSGKPFASM